MKTIFDTLEREGIRYFLSSFSALDRYFHMKAAPGAYIYTEATLIELAKIFPDMEFPGLEHADTVMRSENQTVFIRTQDSANSAPRGTFTVQSLLYDPSRGVFPDTYSVYPDLRKDDLVPEDPLEPGWRTVHDAALLVSRYHYELPAPGLGPERKGTGAPAEDQRTLLTTIMTADHPWKGLAVLMREGYLQAHWPELFQLDRVDHSKEYHPEGNVWEHTIETFKYRKTSDLVLSLGLFLHDVGKPIAQKSEGKPFDGHAELGAEIAERLMRRLGYPEATIGEVGFLVRYHMIPGALNVLPTSRVEKIMASPLFPVLLELYRCDLSSTYRGPDGYYEACNIYKTFLRHTKNPFRSSDGKKLVRLYVE